MNDVSIHVSYVFGSNKILNKIEKIGNTEELGSKRGQVEGPTENREA